MSDPQEGVKEEVREGQAAAYKRHYTSTVLPAVVKTMQSWSHNDVSLRPGVGPPLLTSAPLLAALSPWLRSLMEGAGEVEDFAIILPDITSNQVPPHPP